MVVYALGGEPFDLSQRESLLMPLQIKEKVLSKFPNE